MEETKKNKVGRAGETAAEAARSGYGRCQHPVKAATTMKLITGTVNQFAEVFRRILSRDEKLIAFNEDRLQSLFASNEITLDGEWMKIAPYGDFPNKVGLQRFQKPDAEAMVTAFNSLRGRTARAFMGLPIFVGHPDVDPANYQDKRRYGKITDLAARDDGFYGKVAFNSLGKPIIEEGHYLFNSPAWLLKRDGKFIRPVELLSVGLTNTPQIPGDPWAKNEQQQNERTPMPEWLKNLLVSKGLMKADDNEEAMKTAVNSLLALPARVTELEGKLTTATNEQTRLTTELATANGKVTTLTASNSTLTTERDGLIVARNNRELDLAVTSGRIKVADRVAWNDKLASNFADGVKELHALKIGINTSSQVGDLGKRKDESTASGEKITAINEALRTYAKDNNLNIATNEGYNAAYQGLKKSKPALFAAN